VQAVVAEEEEEEENLHLLAEAEVVDATVEGTQSVLGREMFFSLV